MVFVEQNLEAWVWAPFSDVLQLLPTFALFSRGKPGQYFYEHLSWQTLALVSIPQLSDAFGRIRTFFYEKMSSDPEDDALFALENREIFNVPLVSGNLSPWMRQSTVAIGTISRIFEVKVNSDLEVEVALIVQQALRMAVGGWVLQCFHCVSRTPSIWTLSPGSQLSFFWELSMANSS